MTQTTHTFRTSNPTFIGDRVSVTTIETTTNRVVEIVAKCGVEIVAVWVFDRTHGWSEWQGPDNGRTIPAHLVPEAVRVLA